MGGPRVAEDLQILISSIWMKSLDKGDELSAKEVLSAARKTMDSEGFKHIRLPKLRKVQMILGRERKKLQEGRKKVDILGLGESGLDQPWCLGESAKHNIPSEANEILLKVWKQSIAQGRTFTVREARWVAWLRAIEPEIWLPKTAELYALRERVCDLLGRARVDTTDLDAQLAFGFTNTGDWARYTAVRMGMLPRFSSFELEDEGKLSETQEPFLLAKEGALGYALEWGLGVESKHSLDLNFDSDMVYCLWLLEFNRTRKWENMPPEKKRGLAQRLRKEVEDESKELERLSRSEDLHGIRRRTSEWQPSAGLLHELGILERGKPSQPRSKEELNERTA